MEKESAKVEAGRLRMTVYELEREKCDRAEQDRPEIDQLRAEIGRNSWRSSGSTPARPGIPRPPPRAMAKDCGRPIRASSRSSGSWPTRGAFRTR